MRMADASGQGWMRQACMQEAAAHACIAHCCRHAPQLGEGLGLINCYAIGLSQLSDLCMIGPMASVARTRALHPAIRQLMPGLTHLALIRWTAPGIVLGRALKGQHCCMIDFLGR